MMQELEFPKTDLPEVPQMSDEQRRQAISEMDIVRNRVPRQCEHIKANGEFCGSPALRGRNYCYFHLTHIGRRLRAQRLSQRTPEAPLPLELPPLEDADSIQIALMQVIDAVLNNRLDNKRAGLVLYALQTASSNLARGGDFTHADGATVAGRYDSFEHDYELGDDLPELKAQDGATQLNGQQNAILEKIEQCAGELARDDEEEEAADLAMTEEERKQREEQDPIGQYRASYPCGRISRFFCRLNGPLASKNEALAPQTPGLIEREVARQRIMFPLASPPPGNGAVQTA